MHKQIISSIARFVSGMPKAQQPQIVTETGRRKICGMRLLCVGKSMCQSVIQLLLFLA